MIARLLIGGHRIDDVKRGYSLSNMPILACLKRFKSAVASTRVIIDRHRRLNHPAIRSPWVDTSINKEEAGRAVIFSDSTPAGRFLEIGCGDAELTYLLGIRGNFDYDAKMHDENGGVLIASSNTLDWIRVQPWQGYHRG